MKKTMKILTAILLIAIIACMASNVFAAKDDDDESTKKSTSTEILTQLKDDTEGADVDTSDISATAGQIIAMIRNISIIIGVVIIVILGFKYMVGSLEEKSEYKKSFIPLIVGICVIMGATSIASFLFNLF